MKKIHHLYIAILSVFSSSCEKLVEMELPSDSRKLVVEAQLTTDAEYWEVNLSYTQAFNDQSQPEYVDDALVVIGTGFISRDTLVYSGEGRYRSNGIRRCVPGLEYYLEVHHGGKMYSGLEYCRPQHQIDTFLSFYVQESNLFRERGWYVFEIAKEWEEPGDFYLWKIYRNDTLLNDFGYLTDEDEMLEQGYFNTDLDPADPFAAFAEGRIPNSFPYRFKSGDHARVEQYCINYRFHHYLIEVQNQRSRGGTPFDAPPANPRNNLDNGAVGFFSVVNKVTAETIIP